MSDDTEEPKDEPENSRPKLSLVPKIKGEGMEIPLRPKAPITYGTRRTGYKAGQNVVCTVMKAERGGYEVTIKKDNLPGSIKTIEQLKPGSEILAKFVCVHKGRVLLSPIFQENRSFEERPSLKVVESQDEEHEE